jgi:hypothetical protein
MIGDFKVENYNSKRTPRENFRKIPKIDLKKLNQQVVNGLKH